MPVRLAFVRPNAEPLLLPPYREARFQMSDLIADGTPLARYVDSRWQLRGVGERYARVEFRNPVAARFERKPGERSKALGPYDTFHLLDGVAYASGRVFACFDKQNDDWYALPLGSHWPAMTVVAAATEEHEQPDLAEGSATE